MGIATVVPSSIHICAGGAGLGCGGVGLTYERQADEDAGEDPELRGHCPGRQPPRVTLKRPVCPDQQRHREMRCYGKR